ncbi:MAG: AraC family transcriptional regulator, partial [Bacteroidota bacterium]
MTWYNEQLLIIRDQHFPKPDVVDRLIKAKALMDRHFCDDLAVHSIAHRSLISKFHFTRLFTRCYGRTPYQYITERRILHAKELLIAKVSVTDTCFLLGFESPTSFSAFFKKHTGFPPSAFAQKQA